MAATIGPWVTQVVDTSKPVPDIDFSDSIPKNGAQPSQGQTASSEDWGRGDRAMK